MISQTVEYALRTVLCLAKASPEARTSEQLAEAAQVPQPYLLKIMVSLKRAGVVSAQRGRRGGFSLAKSPEVLTILEVVNAVDPIQRIHECPLGIVDHGTALCPLHRRIDDTLQLVEKAFRETTLAEVLAERPASPPLCTASQEVALVSLDGLASKPDVNKE